MSFSHGKSTSFVWNSVDLSAYLTDLNMPRSIALAETSTFGSTYKSFVSGLIDATISASGMFDGGGGASDATLGGAIGTSAAFTYGPQGTTVGNVKYTGTAILTKYEPKGTIGGAVTFSAELQITGAVTRGTY